MPNIVPQSREYEVFVPFEAYYNGKFLGRRASKDAALNLISTYRNDLERSVAQPAAIVLDFEAILQYYEGDRASAIGRMATSLHSTPLGPDVCRWADIEISKLMRAKIGA